MKPFLGSRRKKDPVPPPGDDVVPVPPPVTEEPPHDSFCDLVLTGGVASGVVYPWAIVELARKYRFRNIGGTSVGAMAAALAAAAEYGRRTGYEAPFEPLRRAPASLGSECPDGRTRMLSLFQTNPDGRRLIKVWGQLFNGNPRPQSIRSNRFLFSGTVWRALRLTIAAYWVPLVIGAAVGVVIAALSLLLLPSESTSWVVAAILGLVVGTVCALACFGWVLYCDIRDGVINNEYGLCKGGTVEHPDSDDGPPGISQWLHDGIQASAGLKDDDPPLTFRDLWTAPEYPGAERKSCGREDPPARRAINLQMLTTNVTHGRPYRLPMLDKTSRLFFKSKELEDYFPPCVLHALVESSIPYAPDDSGSDPAITEPTTKDLYELPAEDLPVVVAARLSLSFPLLFSAVPLWAIDYESPKNARTLRRCIFTDGGASSNFPIHLFDAAVPRWPTFGFWLDRRGPFISEQEVWLPKFNGQGWGDSWNRFDPGSKAASLPQEAPLARLLGFVGGIASSALDWRDRTNMRLPHMRNRVARLLLLPGEGGLHIGMPREQILSMAHRYGARAGKKFVKRFARIKGQPSRAWNEQRWIRFNLLVNGLRDMLHGVSTSAAWSAHTVPLPRAIDEALAASKKGEGPIASLTNRQQIHKDQATALKDLLGELEHLETSLRATSKAFHNPPDPELRLNPPL